MYLPLAGVDKPWIGDIIIGAKAHGKMRPRVDLAKSFLIAIILRHYVIVPAFAIRQG